MSNETVSYTYYAKLMNRIAGWLVKNDKTFKKRDVYNYNLRAADKKTIESVALERYNKNDWQGDGLIAEYVEAAIVDNTDLSFLPAYVTGSDGVKYSKQAYVNMAQRVCAYETLNGRSPARVYLAVEDTTSKNKNALLSKVFGYFGEFETCTEWLKIIKGRGYKFYFNDVYSLDETLNRIWNKQGVNCTDSCELTYNILTALGYTVQVIHVRCKSGTGHVRLRVKHSKWTSGKWEYYDPAAVLSGNAVTKNWCSDGTVLAYDPSWIMKTINR